MTKRKRGNIFTTPYCLLFAKLVPLLTLATQKSIYNKASNVV